MKTFETENYRYGAKIDDPFLLGKVNPKVEYIIDPDKGGYFNGAAYKGVVVCKITPSQDTPLANAWSRKVKRSFDGVSSIVRVLNHEFKNDKKFSNAFKPYVGVAYCSVEDTFDVKIGKRVARERAMAKLFNFQTKYLDTLIDELDCVRDDLFSMYLDCDSHMKDFMGIEEEIEEDPILSLDF